MPFTLRRVVRAVGVLATLAIIPSTAHATFHLMQIERVIGGVNNDVTAQAIQLRMRSGLQNQLQNARMYAWDANGANPILLINMTTPVANSAAGSRVLITSSAMSQYMSATPNYTLAKLIPPSYLAAGKITFEDDFGTVYWGFAWGGASYTGTNVGDISNDADGDFNPPFPGPLPYTNTTSVFFTGAAAALSTNNAANYAISAAGASFTNNAGVSAPVNGLPGCSVIAGSDLFVTPGGGTTQQDFSAQPIPAGFFGPGSDPFTGVASFVGSPLAPASPLGPTDTVVRRNASAVLPGVGSTAVVPIQIVALSLVSVQPIVVTYGGGSPEQWNIQVCLSNSVQPAGTMRINVGPCSCAEGGTFDSQLPVLPKLIFTRIGPPATATFDFGALALPPIQFTKNGGHWLPSDPGVNLAVSPPGVLLDADCNPATPPADLLPTTNFVVGGRADHCLAGSCLGPPRLTVRMTKEQAALASHGVIPSPQTLGPDTDGDFTPDAFDNCGLIVNNNQDDNDDDGLGNFCDNCASVYNPCQEDLNANNIGDVCEVLSVDPRPAARVELSAPVPNPASDQLGFTVSLPRAAKATLEVFDLRGRRIGAATQMALQPGANRINWNLTGAKSLSSGAYYLRLTADGIVRSRSFTIVH